MVNLTFCVEFGLAGPLSLLPTAVPPSTVSWRLDRSMSRAATPSVIALPLAKLPVDDCVRLASRSFLSRKDHEDVGMRRVGCR
jgi:hypothetical protein